MLRVVTSMLVMAAAVSITLHQDLCFFISPVDQHELALSTLQCTTTCSPFREIKNTCAGLINHDLAQECQCEKRRVLWLDGSLAVLPSGMQKNIVPKRQAVQQSLPLYTEYLNPVPVKALLLQPRSPVLDAIQTIVLLI